VTRTNLAALVEGQESDADPDKVTQVRRMMAVSAHKRALPPICCIRR